MVLALGDTVIPAVVAPVLHAYWHSVDLTTATESKKKRWCISELPMVKNWKQGKTMKIGEMFEGIGNNLDEESKLIVNTFQKIFKTG